MVVSGVDAKAKILLVLSDPWWGWGTNARAIKEHLSDMFNFTLWDVDDDINTPDFNDFDMIHCFEWTFNRYITGKANPERTSTQIVGHRSWEEKSKDQLRKILNETYKAIDVPSKILFNIFKELELHPKVFLIPKGVDTEMFKPSQSPIKKTSEFIVGYSGSTGYPKNYYELILPAVKGLEGVIFRTALQIGRAPQLSHEKMPYFYEAIDCIINASSSEGSNFVILEAMASGKAVIATPVGTVPELIKDGWNGLIIEPAIDSISKAIIRLRNDRELCRRMGERNRKVIVDNGLDWEDVCNKHYVPYFDFVLGRS